LEPQDTAGDKIFEGMKLAKLGENWSFLRIFRHLCDYAGASESLHFAPWFLRENHGANKTNTSPHDKHNSISAHTL
jgi:hypothetical protein